jgi:hypothetical protein
MCDKLNADVNTKDAEGENAFVKAVDSGHLEVAQYLHRKRSKIAGKGGKRRLKSGRNDEEERDKELKECMEAAEANGE